MLTPAIGVLLGGVSFQDLKYVITSADGDIVESAILYSNLMQSIVDFLIISASIFLFVKLLSSLKKKEVQEPSASPAPAPEVALLEEIRDLLKSK